jgi:CheY-like chemotaxis protein
MKALRILVVEDNLWLGLILEHVITAERQADVTILSSVAATERELAKSPDFDFAFLDINVTDGQTYGIATALLEHGIHFAFLSGDVRHADVPSHLSHVPFLTKPHDPLQMRRLLDTILK